MGNKNSTPSGGSSHRVNNTANNAARPAGSGGRVTPAAGGAPPNPNAAGNANPNANANNNMPSHLAAQYNNSGPRRTTAPPGGAGAAPNTAPNQQQQQQQQQGGGNKTDSGATTNSHGVQEGQMVKMLATIEASTVSYSPETHLLTFFVTSICPSLTYEIHTGVKEFVKGGTIMYKPNKPKMEPTRTTIEGPQENKKITVKLDTGSLDAKEKAYNKHYPKQMPCVIVIRYRTTELRAKPGDGDKNGNSKGGEEVMVEHAEHTCVDLAERPKRRVINQMVTAGGNAYVVENLYGMDNSPEGGDAKEVMVGSTIAPHEGEDDEDGLCVICLTNLKDTAVMPCRHMCMCKECGEQLLKHKPVCPVCRAPISTLLHMPNANNKA